MMQSRLLVAVALGLATLILIALLTGGSFQTVDNSSVSTTQILLLCGYLVLACGGLYGTTQLKSGDLLKYAAIWLLIAGCLAIVYRVMN
jgi:hypothetical protein